MTAVTRSVLYAYFETGDKPTQSQFQDLIDSSLNLVAISAQSIRSDISALGNIDVAGDVNVGGTLSITGVFNPPTITTTGDITVGGNLSITGQTSAAAMNISGDTSAANIYGAAASFGGAVSALSFNGATGGFSGSVSAASVSFNSNTGLIGYTDGSNAPAGSVGQIVVGSAADGSVALVSNNAKTVTSIALQAGDYDVWGVIRMDPAGTISQMLGGISTTDNTFPGTAGYFAMGGLSVTTGQVMPTPTVTITVSASTNCYLVAQATFTSTTSAGGVITARRRR